MKYIMLFMLVLMCGCAASNTDVSTSFQLPPELENYRVIRLANTSGNHVYVLVKKGNEYRNAIGTSVLGRYPSHTIVIDDVEYTPKGIK